MSKKSGLRLPSRAKVEVFRDTVISHWRGQGRHDLPWRDTTDPYRIFVSEVMLQQTQVARVVPKYELFLKRFPTAKVLSKARLSAVLKEWSGLGYNRRAKFLRNAAKEITSRFKGTFPRAYIDLRSLPGVGEYTAKAMRIFAYNEPDVLVETNVRTAFICHFFAGHERVTDKEILRVARVVAEGQNPREWHWALMDYGSHLKANGVRLNTKSAQYAKQSKFEGSLREVRGAILRSLGFSSTNEESLAAELEFPRERFLEALEGLFKDGLIEEKDGILRLALS